MSLHEAIEGGGRRPAKVADTDASCSGSLCEEYAL